MLSKSTIFVGAVDCYETQKKIRLVTIRGHRNSDASHHARNRRSAHAEIARDLISADGLIDTKHQRE